MHPTVGALTERDLIARIEQRLAPRPEWLLVGIGDDAAVVEPARNRVDAITVDAVVEGIHFDRAFTPPLAIGHRALAVNLSDLAAMGAAPRFALVSMVLPASLPLVDYDAIVDGLTTLARAHRVHVVGGNLTRSPGPLMIDVTVAGTLKRRQALTRAGARPGDELYVSGVVGAAGAGLARLRAAAVAHDTGAATVDSSGEPGSRAASADDPAVRAYLFPEPRVRLGIALARNRAASACVDLSDGLADGARRIADASGVGVTIDADALPIDAAARDEFARTGPDAVERALSLGDDYELLFTVRPRTRRRLKTAAQHGGVTVTRIGECTADRALVVRRGAAAAPLPSGFTHFA